MDLLPATFAENLGPALSPQALHRLILELPGVRVRVPAKANPNHRLAAALSQSELGALCSHAKGRVIEIPTGNRLRAALLHRQIAEQAARGLTVPEIAAHTGVTPRWVRKVLGAQRATPHREATP